MGLGSEDTAGTVLWGVWTNRLVYMAFMWPGMINECRASPRPFSDRQTYSGHQYIKAFRAKIYSSQISEVFKAILNFLYYPV